MRVWNKLYLFIENLATYYLIFSLLSALHRVDKSLVCILAFNPFKKEKKMKKKKYTGKSRCLTLDIDVYVFKI